MPLRNASNASVLNISRADIYRLAETLDAPLSLSEEEFASRSTLIANLPITDADFVGRQLSFTDSLDFAGQAARLRYAVRFVNASGQKAAFSNFLVIEPTAKVAGAPASLTVEVTQNAILLRWNAPSSNVDGSTPPNIIGYNIYRIESEKGGLKMLNGSPVTDTKFSDKFFEFEKDYSYFLRTVSLGTSGNPLESLDSNTVKVASKDTFPPSPPAAVTIAASPNTISIFFAANPENDVVGYRIYRSTEPNRPKSEWALLTEELLKTNTFQDTAIQSGITYYYYLTAIDKYGNVSEPSEVYSETAP